MLSRLGRLGSLFCFLAVCSANDSLGRIDTGPLVLIYTAVTTRISDSDESPNRVHLVIHRSRHELSVYRGENVIKRYRIAIGRPGWETPLGEFQILQMVENPVWKHPLTGEIFEAGEPGNELGKYWIGFWTNGKVCAGFHGTPHPETVGKSVSHGCVRMYDKDVEELFRQVNLGTLVAVVP